MLGVNAFDQPDVQDSKTRTKDKIKSYRETGKLVEGKFVKLGPKLKPALKQLLAQVHVRYRAEQAAPSAGPALALAQDPQATGEKIEARHAE